jgi:hypothetical protein
MTGKAQCGEFAKTATGFLAEKETNSKSGRGPIQPQPGTIQVREKKSMKKSFCSGLAIILLTFATVAGARPIKLPPPPPANASLLPPAFWLSLFTIAVR